MSNGEFLRHEPCPACGSRDNLGVWDDGHKWCFGCGYYVPGYKTQSLADLRQQIKEEEQENNKKNAVTLPADFTYNIPFGGPREWITQYLTEAEIYQHRLGWSNVKQYLVFPVFDCHGNLLLWQGRYFGSDKKHPKYDTKGYPQTIYHCVGRHVDDGGLIVVVEDIPSAIVVGRVATALPLFGSQFTIKRIRKLADNYKRLALWLDADKQEYVIRAQFRAMPYFDKVAVITTRKDPKAYGQEQVSKYLLSRGVL